LEQRNIILAATKRSNKGKYIVFKKNIFPLFLLVYCLCLSITIVFIDIFYIKLFQFLFIFILILLTQKKYYIFGSCVILISTVLLNILFYEGKTVLYLFTFPITSDAIKRGLTRAFSLLSLFNMSKLLLLNDIYFRGRIGFGFAKIFGYFNYFIENVKSIKTYNIGLGLDELIIKFNSKKIKYIRNIKYDISIRDYILYCGILAGNIILLILNYSNLIIDNR
jgi:hypothetical protein